MKGPPGFLLHFLTMSCFVCLWQMPPFMVIFSYLVSALVWCWNSFLHWEFPWGGICCPSRWYKGGKNDTWLQGDFSFSPTYTQMSVKASAGCAVLTHFGVFFSVTSYLLAVYRNVSSFIQLFINVSVLQELMTCFGQKHSGYQQVICSCTECRYGRSSGYRLIFTRNELSFFYVVKFKKTFRCTFLTTESSKLIFLDVGWNLF
jgi:hypothetical protein